MKKLTLPLFAIVLILSACSKTDLVENQKAQELTWTVYDNDTIVKEINSNQSNFRLEMNAQSQCSGHGIKLTIAIGSHTIFESNIIDFPFEQTFYVNQNSNIKITTAYDDSRALSICDHPTVIDIKVNF